MKTIIITAADETMSGLLVDLLQSLSQWGAPLCDAIGVLDVGLSATSRQRVQEMTGNVLVPGWDLDLDNELREQKPYLRAITAKPFLRDCCSGSNISRHGLDFTYANSRLIRNVSLGRAQPAA